MALTQAQVLLNVNTNIYANGISAITGTMLNSVLNNMYQNIYSAELDSIPVASPASLSLGMDLRTALATLEQNINVVANYTYINGLTFASSTLKLGGALTQNTALTGNYTLTLGSLGSPLQNLAVNTTTQYSSLVGNPAATYSEVLQQDSLLSLLAYTSGGTSQQGVVVSSAGMSLSGNGSNNRLIVYDDLGQKGLVGAINFSSNYTPNSYVQKSYVTGGFLPLTLTSNTSVNGFYNLEFGNSIILNTFNAYTETQTYLRNYSGGNHDNYLLMNSAYVKLFSSDDNGSSSTFSLTPYVATLNKSLLFTSGYGIDTTLTGGTDVLSIGATNADVINYGNSNTVHNFLGTAIYELQVNSYVTDKLITLNYGGSVASGLGVGFEIEENSVITGYFKVGPSRDSYRILSPAIPYYSDVLLSSLTANRSHTLPDQNGIFTVLGNTTTGSGSIVLATAPTLQGLALGSASIGTSINLRNSMPLTGNVSFFNHYTDGQIQSGVTTQAVYYQTAVTTQAASFTLGNLYHYATAQGGLGAGSTVNRQVGFHVSSTLTGATNNYGFFGEMSAAPGRYNLIMAGTAQNYFEGSTSVGVSVPIAKLHVQSITEQLRLGYDASNRMSVTVGSTGSTTFALTGTSPIFTFSQSANFSTDITTPLINGVSGLGLNITTTRTAAASFAAGTLFNSTLTTSANNDILYGAYIAPIFNNTGAYTGVINYSAGFGAGIFITHAKSTGSALYGINIFDSSPFAANVGGGLRFSGFSNTGTQALAAAIDAIKDNATGGDFGFGLRFQTRRNGDGNTTGTLILTSVGSIVSTPLASTSGTITNFLFTKPNNTGQTLSTPIIGFNYLGGTRQWNTGNITTQVENSWGATTYSFVGASIITTAIGNDFYAPIAGTNATITNNYAARFNGNILFTGNIIPSLPNTQNIGNGSNYLNQIFSQSVFSNNISSNLGYFNTIIGSLGYTNFIPAAQSSGAVTIFDFRPPANTNQTASTEVIGLGYSPSTQQWATGALATQRELWFRTRTYSFVAASIITNAYGAYIEAPTAGTNCTITNNFAAGFDNNIQINNASAGKGVFTGNGFLGVWSANATHYGFYHTAVTPSTQYALLQENTGNTYLNSGGTTVISVSATAHLTLTTNLLTVKDLCNISLNTSTGTKIGTATTQKLSFWNATPIVQPASALQAAVSGTAGAVYTTTEQTLINDLKTLVNQLRADLVAAGNIKGSA